MNDQIDNYNLSKWGTGMTKVVTHSKQSKRTWESERFLTFATLDSAKVQEYSVCYNHLHFTKIDEW